MDEGTRRLLDDTLQRCRRDPYAAQIRKTMMRELRRRVDAGLWAGPGSGPRLFQLDRSDDDASGAQIDMTWCTGFQDLLDIGLRPDAANGNVGLAMRCTAEAVEEFVSDLREGRDLAARVPEERRAEAEAVRLDNAAIECQLRAVAEAGDSDLISGYREGYSLLGFGMASAVWKVNRPGTYALAKARLLPFAPHRHDAIAILFAGRDGVLWSAEQLRYGDPVALAWPHEEQGRVGDIPNALSRLTNAMCGDAVPIWPADLPPDHPIEA